MATSRLPGPLRTSLGFCSIPARTPGPLGIFDQADPDITSLLGDTPGPLGVNDWACRDLPFAGSLWSTGSVCRADDGTPLALATGAVAQESVVQRKPASQLTVSEKGMHLLREIESLHLKPYDDQNGKDITAWVKGATIGYGHLIAKGQWEIYKNGMTDDGANTLFAADLDPFAKLVQQGITVNLAQQEFDALVILAFNIGPANFSDSSVVKLVNDPDASTSYASLEAAWKAWNKSQGKVMKGLDNRRQCEWDIYTKGVYQRW